jgi:PmbA protein
VNQALDLVADLIARAKAAGADAADALRVEGTALSHARRLGKTEKLERAEGRDIGLRVFVGRRQAMVSSSDDSPKALAELVGRAVAMARAVPEDPFAGLAEPGEIARQLPTLDIDDPHEPAAEVLLERAAACEEAALAVNGITNSEGAEAGWSRSRVALAASNGFAGEYAVARHSVGVAVIAGEGLAMQRDYDYSSAVHGADLDDAAQVGARAAERAIRRLGARKIKSARVPVIYDPRVANSLVRHVAGAANGATVARGTSFLKDSLGLEVMAPGLTIIDDPHRPRGLASKPFDGEGVRAMTRRIVDAGRLTTWFLDCRSARQLKMTTTGHAARGTSSPPSPAPTNLFMEAGARTPAELMADIESGLYVTELIGMGVNMVTGDYSRGAAGFWIERGALAYPVNEITIAGNLKDMFRAITPANDLVFRYGTDAPTLRVDGMTVAGASED